MILTQVGFSQLITHEDLLLMLNKDLDFIKDFIYEKNIYSTNFNKKVEDEIFGDYLVYEWEWQTDDIVNHIQIYEYDNTLLNKKVVLDISNNFFKQFLEKIKISPFKYFKDITKSEKIIYRFNDFQISFNEKKNIIEAEYYKITDKYIQLHKEREEYFKNTLSTADSFFNEKNFQEAGNYYLKARSIKPKQVLTDNKIKKNYFMKNLLIERKVKIFDYMELQPYDATFQKNNITEKVFELIFKNNIKPIHTEILVKINIDTNGITETNIDFLPFNSVDNLNTEEILNLISPKIKELKLIDANIEGYSVFAELNVKMEVEVQLENCIVNKYFDKSKIVSDHSTNSLIKNYENQILLTTSEEINGFYTITNKFVRINSKDNFQTSILKHESFGGPLNLFKSVLIPGGGIVAVTGGNETATLTQVGVGTSLLVGLFFKEISNGHYQEYLDIDLEKMYNNTRDYIRKDMEEKYTATVDNHNYFLFFTALGATIWLYDIYWVGQKGFENLLINNTSIYLNHDNKSIGLNYKYTF